VAVQKSNTLFHEVQALRQWHGRMVLALPPAALLFIAVRQIVFRQPWGHPPMTNGSVVFLTVLLVAVYFRLITVRLVTDLGPSELSVGLKGLWRSRRIPLLTIRAAKAVSYDSAAEYGGYGIRSGARGMAYIASGNRGVELELSEGPKLLVGSQRAEELAAKIMQARKTVHV
jgi:hypothetical protein